MIYSQYLTAHRVARDAENPTASLTFRVISSIDDSTSSIVHSPGIPQLSDLYQFGGETIYPLLCDKVECTRVGRVRGRGRTMLASWDVTASYRLPNDSAAGGGGGSWEDWGDDDPPPNVEDPFTMSSSWEYVQVPFMSDRFGNKITNTAGDMYTTVPMVQKAIEVIDFSRKEYRNPSQTKQTYSHTVNANTWSGKPAGTLFLIISANYNSGLTVNYRMKYDPGGWKKQIASTGFNQIIDDRGNDKKVAITDDRGQPISIPARLDQNGKVIPEGSNDVYFQQYEVYRATNFSALNLPPII